MSEPRIADRLRANADLTEKALAFMADPEQIEEAKADIALWREAASQIDTLRKAVTKVKGDGSTNSWAYSILRAALEAVDG